MLTRWISDNRRGFALATAVGAIALVGALVAGSASPVAIRDRAWVELY